MTVAHETEDLDGNNRPDPGSYEFIVDKSNAIVGMDFVCPCGCGRMGYLNFKDDKSPRWKWDGNETSPTVEPSVHWVLTNGETSHTHWHGWLKGGVWTSVGG